MTKKCKECGIIFTTDNPDQQICTLCEDDRKAEDEADNDYDRNASKINRYYRRYFYSKKGILRSLLGVLVVAMDWVNENLIRGCE